MKKRGICRKVALLTFAFLLMFCPAAGGKMTALADTGKTITGLGTGAISNPVPGVDTSNQPWKGSYVYYGKDVKYRVLTVKTSDFSGTTMLLDCDMIFDQRFDGVYPYSNDWSASSAKDWLNREFLTTYFTAAEQSAIATSQKEKINGEDGPGYEDLMYKKLGGEKIFLLDAVEATRSSYGYPTAHDGGPGNGRIKSGNGLNSWWLRSPSSSSNNQAGSVNMYGNLDHYIHVNVSNNIGLSPAFNVNLSSVLFSSVIKAPVEYTDPDDMTTYKVNGEYKLTLTDSSINPHSGEGVTRTGETTISVPYTKTGTSDHVSLLITNKDDSWTTGIGWSSNAEMQYYTTTAVAEGSSNVTLSLPDNFDSNKSNWKVWILVEKVNDTYETDYASAPVEITVPDFQHVHSWSYTASGDTITAKCDGAGTCDITSGLTLTISAPAEPLIYDGTTRSASLSIGYNTTAFPGAYVISYEKDGQTVPAADVKDAGSYTAKVTVGNATASVNFIIQPKAITASAEDVSVTYDGKAHGISVSVTDPANGATIKYGKNYTLDESPAITDVADSPLTVYYQVTAGSNYSAFSGSATVTITKVDQAAPAAPTVKAVTSTSIRLAELNNGEYKCGDGNWQSSPEFTGLKKDTEYTFSQRLKKDGNHNASPEATAKFSTAKTYQVAYEITGTKPEGAPAAPADPAEYEKEAEVTVKAALFMTGYTFSGWDTEDAKVTDGKFTMPDKNVTLSGSWKVNQHTLTVLYQYSDGSTAAETVTKSLDYGEEYSVASPAVEGYTASRETVSGKMPDEDVSVTVTYGVNPHRLTVTYEYADGKKAADDYTENLEYGAKYSVSSPEITGYTADQPSVSGEMPDKELTVKVIYQVNRYKVTFVDEDGKTILKAAAEYDYGTKIALPAEPVKEGFTFSGWDPAIPESMPAKDLTFTAKWTPIETETEPTVEPAVDTTPDPIDPNTKIFRLFRIHQKKVTNNSITFTWKKISGATSYTVYGSRCGKTREMKKLGTVKKTTYTYKNLKKNKYYKFYVVAKKGKKKLATSVTIHIATSGGRHGNPAAVTVKNKIVTLAAKNTYLLKASVKDSGKVNVHKSRALIYESSNPKVAKVNKNGKVTAVAKGSCYVYIYAQNGIYTRVRVKVK